jgi:hypothetical protein
MDGWGDRARNIQHQTLQLPASRCALESWDGMSKNILKEDNARTDGLDTHENWDHVPQNQEEDFAQGIGRAPYVLHLVRKCKQMVVEK